MSRASCIALLVLSACEPHARPRTEPVYTDIEPLFLRSCVECHAGDAPAAGWRADAYLAVIGCPTDQPSAVLPGGALSRALERPDHQGLLAETERSLVRAWVDAGAPARRGSAHPGGWADPRSPSFHGASLRAARWAPLLDGSCARCHAQDELPRDAGVAPGATPCTSCHTDEGGPLACATCHGTPGRPYPPRDRCVHPDEREGAHAAHGNIDCAICHGTRTIEGLASGEHGDGTVQIVLDPAITGGGTWDAATRTCTNACHDRGGAGPGAPSWEPTALDCGSCHSSPPADHYEGGCDRCHAEAAADGASLRSGPLHGNGAVDLGDGSGGCGACHGRGDDPSPATGAHAAHRSGAIALPIDCDACHQVPSAIDGAGHFDDAIGAEVVFGALASARGATPVYSSGECSNVACHGAGLGGGAHATPRWAGDLAAGRCGACHGVPPPAPHTSSADCSASICHGGAIAPGPRLTELGRMAHVDGRVDP